MTVYSKNANADGPEQQRAASSSLGAIIVYCPTNIGGVRQVTESLALGIEQTGRVVVRVHSLRELLKLGLARRAGCAILSLQAGYLSFLFPKCIYILHGFPFVGHHSPMRRVAIRMAARVASWAGASLVAVSYLTRSVHERIYGIPVNHVIFNGCSDSLNEYASRPPGLVAKRKVVMYVGRLIDVKGVRTIVEAFLASSLPSLGYTLKLAGSGGLAPWISAKAKANPTIALLGEIPEEAKERLLFESEAFVSLNDFEPMGVVFAEAALTGCKIVAPICGGHREFIPADHPISLCDPKDVHSVAGAFDRLPHLAPPTITFDATLFSYRWHIAPRYLRVLDGNVSDEPLRAPVNAHVRAAAQGGRH